MYGWLRSQLAKVTSDTDSKLVRKAKKGNRDAFGILYLKYLGGIYRYFYFRIGQDRPAAEDMSQQVFFKAWEALPTYQERGLSFSAWLYRIAHNHLVDSYRRQREVARLSDFYPSEEDTFGEIVVAEEHVLLYKAIRSLSDDQKQVVLLKFVEDFGNREISLITGKKQDAIRALQHRALEKLRKILEIEE